MSDQEYIKGLEYLVKSFANAYQVNFEKFYWENFKTCSITNPNRRELTELEKTIIMRFTTYQGSFRKKVKQIANLKIEQPENLTKTVEHLLKHKSMSIAKEILFDELIEQGHSEEVEKVIFWALEAYCQSEPKGTIRKTIAYAIKQRILDAEAKGISEPIMNPKLVKSLIKQKRHI